MTRDQAETRCEPPGGETVAHELVRVPPPTVTRDEIDLLIRRAGLTLNAGQKADLAVAYQHIVTLAAKLPRARPFADEPAFVFHPPLPRPPIPPAEQPAATATTKPAGEKPVATRTKGARKAAAAAKAAAQPTAARKVRPAKPTGARGGRAKGRAAKGRTKPARRT